jgi:ribosome recycling factor
MVARVSIPDITPEERGRRMKNIHKAAENLLKGVETK